MDVFARKDSFIFSESEMSFEELPQLPGATRVSRKRNVKMVHTIIARFTFSNKENE